MYRSAEHASLIDADDRVAAISHPPDGDLFHPIVRVVDLGNGDVVAELDDDGLGATPIAFSPVGDGRLLVSHSRHDRAGLLIWSPATGEIEEILVELPGDVNGTWLPDGSGLLLVVSLDGRDRIHRLDLATGTVEALESPGGVVDAYSVRNDGTVQALVESAADAPTLVEIGGDPIVVFDGEPPAPSVPAESIHADGPAGRVHAFLHRPTTGDAPYPTVFAVHGGPTAQDLDAYQPRVATLVDAGYAVVRVNYRGSTGYGRRWRDALVARLGAIEMEDIGAVRNHLVAEGIVDPDRLAMIGGSWGGFMTLFALGVEPEAWSAGVALVPLADFAISQEDQPAFMTAYDHALFGGTLEELPDEYRAASPLTYVDAVRSPLLITAGANDPRCPPRATDVYVERLRARGHDVVYVRKDTGHASYDNERLVEEIGLALDFLESRLPPRSSAPTVNATAGRSSPPTSAPILKCASDRSRAVGGGRRARCPDARTRTPRRTTRWAPRRPWRTSTWCRTTRSRRASSGRSSAALVGDAAALDRWDSAGQSDAAVAGDDLDDPVHPDRNANGVGVRSGSGTRTVPCVGSTSTWAPCGMRVVAPCAPITAAIPNSRATIAAWQTAPPSSTTSAPMTGSSEFVEGPVNGAISTSPGSS